MLYPLFLKLSNEPVLVVGAGEVALAKIKRLLLCGAQVSVVGKHVGHGVRELAESGALVLEERAFVAEDVQGQRVVIAATNEPSVNEAVMRASRARGILVNVVDDPDRCDFFVPSVVDRGKVQVAISTEGASPGLARQLKAEIEPLLHPSLGEYADMLAGVRAELRQRFSSSPERRRMAIEAVLSSAARRLLEAGDRAGAESAMHSAVESSEAE